LQLIMYQTAHGGNSTYRYVVFDGNNESDSSYIDITFSIGYLGIDETPQVEAKHYPNPVNDQLTIELSEFEGQGNIEIHNMVGQKVVTQSINGLRNNINVSALENGVYFYSIIADGETRITKKFIVSK